MKNSLNVFPPVCVCERERGGEREGASVCLVIISVDRRPLEVSNCHSGCLRCSPWRSGVCWCHPM